MSYSSLPDYVRYWTVYNMEFVSIYRFYVATEIYYVSVFARCFAFFTIMGDFI